MFNYLLIFMFCTTTVIIMCCFHIHGALKKQKQTISEYFVELENLISLSKCVDNLYKNVLWWSNRITYAYTYNQRSKQTVNFTVPILQRSKKYFVYLPFQYWEISSSFINMLLVLHSMLLLDFFRSKTIGINHYSYMSGHGPMFQMVALLNLSNLCCKTNLYETPPDFINNFISYY